MTIHLCSAILHPCSLVHIVLPGKRTRAVPFGLGRGLQRQAASDGRGLLRSHPHTLRGPCAGRRDAQRLNIRLVTTLLEVSEDRPWAGFSRDALQGLVRQWGETIRTDFELANTHMRWPASETVRVGDGPDALTAALRQVSTNFAKQNKQLMELLSDLSTWGERFLDFWDRGVYACARCERPLYASDDKWSGPCLWPSWRRDLPGAARHAPVEGYNGYVVDVHELYCGGCDLFLGHAFADARDKGDAHPDARWRH